MAAKLRIVTGVAPSSAALTKMPSDEELSNWFERAPKMPAKVIPLVHEETSMLDQVMMTGRDEPSPSRSSPTRYGLVKPVQSASAWPVGSLSVQPPEKHEVPSPLRMPK